MKTPPLHLFVLSQILWATMWAVPAMAEMPTTTQIQSHLDAGEFGLATATANRLGPNRDKWLGRIAIAQARTGAISASQSTLRQMDDDRELSSAAASVFPNDEGAAGGSTMADFDSLIDLITSTVSPDSWDEVGGPGSIAEFAGGVYVDAQGVLRRLRDQTDFDDTSLDQRKALARSVAWSQTDPRRPSDMRMISLPRLERELKIRHAFGESPSRTMQHLAGLREIKYVFVYPETGDLVIAGPAGDWQVDSDGLALGHDRRPVLRLDDLVVLFRNAYQSEGRFGCSITPKRENLARTKQFLAHPRQPLKPRQTPRWIEQVRAQLGLQNVEVHGVDATTHVARVLVEADYHMKLIGMGLEPSVPEIESYLDSMEPDNIPATMDVLRWWFTLRDTAMTRNRQGDAFALVAHSVRLQSENELINAHGERLHTGTSSELNQLFADRFTRGFGALAKKYPLYAELDHLFDIALVATLIHHRGLDALVGWDPLWLLDPSGYQPQQGEVPREVPSIVNHRVVNRRQIVAGVSGGVSVNALAAMRSVRTVASSHGLDSDKDVSRPSDNDRSGRWWWD